MDWKGTILDNMGYFTLTDIPNLVIAMLVAALLTFICAKFGLRAIPGNVRKLLVLAAMIAMGVGLVNGQLPFAVILASILIVSKERIATDLSGSGILIAMLIGFGCGIGASLITLTLVAPLILVLRSFETSE